MKDCHFCFRFMSNIFTATKVGLLLVDVQQEMINTFTASITSEVVMNAINKKTGAGRNFYRHPSVIGEVLCSHASETECVKCKLFHNSTL